MNKVSNYVYNIFFYYSFQVLSVFLVILSLTAAQHRPQNPRFQNPGFRNVRTPLATAAARDRSYISIPIVLLPDGQALPKPKHATYHYVGHANQNRPQTNNPRNNKNRGYTTAKSTATSPVAIPLPSPPQPKKTEKLPKLTVSQINSHLRSSQSTFQKNRGAGNTQPNQSQKPPQQTFEQSQQMHQVQYVKQQKNPTIQQQNVQSQQALSNHKQNVANFVNFATNLGASILSQQQNQPVILPTQPPSSGFAFQNQPNHKIQENFSSQKSLLSNHKLNNGIVFQHQVPNLQSIQLHYGQHLPNNLASHNNNGYAAHLQQLPQQSQTSSHSHQQQDQAQQQTLTTSPVQNQYLSASTLRPNTQATQGANIQNTAQFSGNQAQVLQQNGLNNLRTQSNQNNVVLLNNYNSQIQQSNQQNYASSTTPQQPTPAPQVGSSYEMQTLSKSTISSQQQQEQQQPQQQQQQTSGTEYGLNSHNLQTSYINQNHANQQNYNLNVEGHQDSFPNSAQASLTSYPSSQVLQTNPYSIQNTQASVGQLSDPLAYFQYQTAQDLPLTYASLFNQGQAGYIASTQNGQHNEAALTGVDQSYAVLPNSQSAFNGPSFPTIFVSSQQEESSSNNSPSDIGLQTYESLSNDQPAYLPSSNQANQATYISTQNLEKGYNFLPGGSEAQTSQSGENQLSHSSSNAQSSSNTQSNSAENAQLVYSSSSPKQISFTQAQSTYASSPQQYSSSSPTQYSSSNSQQYSSLNPQQYSSSSPQQYSSSSPQQYSSSSYQSSPTYVAFSATTSDKSDSQTSQTYAQKASTVITPGTTYAKLTQNTAKTSETSDTAAEDSGDSEYDEDDETEEEEASYKVVYIPLDILKNILSNSVEQNQ